MKKYRKRIQVFCSHCKMWINEEDVKFINIEEDIQGADILTFVCPDCGQTSKSRRYG